MFMRAATADDADAMAWIMNAASRGDPAYAYRYPDRHNHPEDFDRRCRRKVAEYLREATVMVYEMASEQDPEKVRVVAFAVWLMPEGVTFDGAEVSSGFDDDVDHPLPIGLTVPADGEELSARSVAFRMILRERKASLFDAIFQPSGYCFLKQLMCHPEYQGRGAGTRLTNEGICVARRHGRATALFASPMGFSVYRNLGFKVVERCLVQVNGEPEAKSLSVTAMALHP